MVLYQSELIWAAIEMERAEQAKANAARKGYSCKSRKRLRPRQGVEDMRGQCTHSRAGRCVMASRPNVVLILVDDMGFNDLGIMGSEIRTRMHWP